MRDAAQGATHFVHCAAIAGVDTVLASPVRTMRVNVIGTYNALEAAVATLPSLERFVDFSTSEVFGSHALNVTEGHVSTIGSVGEARWTYAVSKLAGEHMAHAYHDELGLPTVTVHPFNIFGPGQIGGGAIRAFIEASLGGRDLTIHGDGAQIRAWTYVTDMVSGVLLCLEHPAAVGQAFNIGNPRGAVTIFDLAQRIKRLSGAPGEIVFQPLHYADVELRIPNVAKAREVLGWEPQVELDEGLEKTIAWYRAEERIRLGWPELGEEELAEVAEVLESGMLTMGPKVGEFEAELARACEVEHALAVSSGTAALHLAVLALGLQPGDEVLVPAYTFPATANVCAIAGLRPVLVDVDPDTMNIDPAKVEVGPRTKAVLAVHLFGRPAPLEDLPGDLLVLEDAAGALGARHRGRACGGLGLLGCLSFHPRKIVTTGEGGAVTTNDAQVAEAIAAGRNHGWVSLVPPDLPAPGLNYRISDILCAVGLPQMRRLDDLLATRARIAEGYTERLQHLPVLLPRADEGDVHGWQAYVLQVDDRDACPRRAAGAGDRGADRHLRPPPAGRLPRPGRLPGRGAASSSGRSRCPSTPASPRAISTGWRQPLTS